MTPSGTFFRFEKIEKTKINRCCFNTKYFDYSKKETANFACDEIALASGLCIFHDKNYSNDKELDQKISDKIKSVLAKNETLFCIGYNIPDLKIKETFKNFVYFTKASFTNTDFSSSKFQSVDFSGAKFQNANFSKATFEEADFLAVEFSGKANFSNTVFKKKVNFSESVFNKRANFNGSSMKRAQFLGSKFQTADFGLTKIEDSDFYGVLFSGVANFIGTDIKRSVFPNSRFQGKTRFTGAKFEKTEFPQSNFAGTDFDHASMKVMKFHGTTFSGPANFYSSKLEKVDLYQANFEKNSNFAEATLREVIFSDGKFQGNSNFAYVIFQDDVRFKNVELQGADFSFAKFFGKTYFNDVLFGKPDRVNFDVENLSKVSFRNTDVTKVRFGERVKWGGDDGFRIVDEELLNKNNEKKILESVIAIYRNLRKNYERRFRNEEAQKFFLRELELKKLYYGKDASLIMTDSELVTKKLEDLSYDLHELKEKVDDLEKLTKRKQELESNKVY